MLHRHGKALHDRVVRLNRRWKPAILCRRGELSLAPLRAQLSFPRLAHKFMLRCRLQTEPLHVTTHLHHSPVPRPPVSCRQSCSPACRSLPRTPTSSWCLVVHGEKHGEGICAYRNTQRSRRLSHPDATRRPGAPAAGAVGSVWRGREGKRCVELV
jgi:hypothetical protein